MRAGYRIRKPGSGRGKAWRQASSGSAGCPHPRTTTMSRVRVKSLAPYAYWVPCGCDHPFINCSSKLFDHGNIWVLPPGPDWWQSRICINLVKAPGERTNLRWLFYSAAVEGVSHGLSLTFNPPTERSPAPPHLPRLWPRGRGLVASYLVSNATCVHRSACSQPSCPTLL